MFTVSFIYPFFFLCNQIFCYRFLCFYESQSVQISYTSWEWPSILWDRKPRWWNLFLPSFSISHSSVIHREICVKDFSGTTTPRILKFGTVDGYDLLYCVRENQHVAAYHSPYLSIFLSLQAKFLLQISKLLWDPESSIFYTHWEWSSILWDRKQNWDLCCLFLLFSICHSNLIHREICDQYFSRTVAHRIL